MLPLRLSPTLPALLTSVALATLAPAGTVDFTGYDPASEIEVRQPGPGTLVAIWRDREGDTHRANFDLTAGHPLIASLATAADSGAPVEIAATLDPRFRVTLGHRVPRTSWPYIFFEHLDTNPPGTRTFLSELDPAAVRVVTDSPARTRLVFSGLRIGPYSGELTCTLYHGSPLLHFQASMHVTDPWVAFIHDSLFFSDFETVAYRDSGGTFHTADVRSLPATEPGAAAALKVKHRTLLAPGANGTLALFPAPHTCVFPTDNSDNLGGVQAGKGFIGTHMRPQGDGVWQPWIDAPAGSAQKMDVFLLPSRGGPEATLERVLRYTHGDRFKELPGRFTMVEHFHPEFTMAHLEGRDDLTPFKETMQAMGIRIVQPMEFHGPGHPFNNGTERLREMKTMFELLAKHSDENFLIIPGEEYNHFFGGHWSYLFPKPVYFTGWPDQGDRTYKRGNVEVDGTTIPTVYQVGDAEHMMRLFHDEGGIAWTSHPRVKDSYPMPDRAMDSFFYKDPAFQAGDWKAMPMDLSHDRLGMRGFKLMDDTAQLGFRKHMLGEVDTFDLRPDHEIYAHMNANYLRLDAFPKPDDWSAVVECVKNGDFFTSTGEVLIHEWKADTKGVSAEVEWTFPPGFAEITWGDNKGVHKGKQELADVPEFSTGAIRIDADLSQANWVRFEAWDIARNGAFTQPYWLREPANPKVVAGTVTGFTLFDADTDAPVPGFDPIPEGAVLDRSKLPRHLNFRANTVPLVVKQVTLVLDDGEPILERNWPYTAGFAGVADGLRGCPFYDYAPLELETGAHTLTATPSNGTVDGTPATLHFQVIAEPAP